MVCLKLILKFESLHSSVDSRVTLYYLYDSGGKNEWLSLVPRLREERLLMDISGVILACLPISFILLNMDN